MKTIILKSLSSLGICLAMALSAGAQQKTKEKVTDNEYKYKSGDVKIKEEEGERKVKNKGTQEKTKEKATDNEYKYKSGDVKIKDEGDERKVKTKVKPLKTASTQQVEVKKGETNVRTKEQVESIPVNPAALDASVAEKGAKTEVSTNVKVTPAKKPVVHKTTTHKRVVVAAKQPAMPRKYIVRTKVVRDTVTVRDTVVVASPPEKIVTTQTEYVHDTVIINRVDTVVTKQTENTYNGYNVPQGDFKKVKLKKDKNGEVIMKRK